MAAEGEGIGARYGATQDVARILKVFAKQNRRRRAPVNREAVAFRARPREPKALQFRSEGIFTRQRNRDAIRRLVYCVRFIATFSRKIGMVFMPRMELRKFRGVPSMRAL